MVHAAGALALAAYLLALVQFTRDFLSNRSSFRLSSLYSLLIAIFAHTVVILTTFSANLMPTGRADFYLLLGFCVTMAYLAVCSSVKFPILGAFASGAAMLFMASSSYLLHLMPSRSLELGVTFLILHVLPALIAELAMVLAVVLGIIFRIQGRRLKRKESMSTMVVAPSLHVLDSWIVKLLNAGFVSMSFSVATGSVWALFNQRSIFTSDPLQWMGFLVWILLAGIHLARNIYGRSAGFLAKLTIGAGALILAALAILIAMGKGTDHAELYLQTAHSELEEHASLEGLLRQERGY